jgi:hypothetical protein
VADRRHRLAGVEERLHERDRAGGGADEVAVDDPAGQHQGVEGARVGIVDGQVDRPGPAVVDAS